MPDYVNASSFGLCAAGVFRYNGPMNVFSVLTVLLLGFNIGSASAPMGDPVVEETWTDVTVEDPVSSLDATAVATCLNESGAQFFGADWCPHCQAQKDMFGGAADLLPYVECAADGENSQTAYCTEMDIVAYPTWIFADGTRIEGVTQMDVLSEMAVCEL